MTPWQIACACAGAFVIGFSKGGVPGTGILLVPLMAVAFPGRLALGATVPVLVIGDICAVAFYHAHSEKSHLRKLAPFVLGGITLGAIFVKYLPPRPNHDPVDISIGLIVLVMLALQVLRKRLGDKLVPTSPSGVAATGAAAGFATMAGNAAGPIMSIYMTAAGLPKNQFMGTAAVYFFVFNLVKLPFLAWLTAGDPAHPLVTSHSLLVDLYLAPVVIAGAFIGRKLLPHIDDRLFTNVVLVLAAVAALKLVIG